jgi:hypothetical protein
LSLHLIMLKYLQSMKLVVNVCGWDQWSIYSWNIWFISKGTPTILYKDNIIYIAQWKGEYIKGDRTKQILSKFFLTHDFEKCGNIDVQQICSKDNLVDLFTKALPTTTFEGLQHNIGMRQLKDMRWYIYEKELTRTALFFP